jgi:hypothetical protein
MQSRSKLVRHFAVVSLSAAALLLSGCFAEQAAAATGDGAPGFWMGLWHGIIAPIAFIVSLFSDHVRIYAVPHAGRWYDFGFMIGIGGFTHGASRGVRRRRPKRARDDAD